MVVSAHPDDEILGAGGTLIRHAQAGDIIGWVICTDILADYGFTEQRIEERNREINKIAEGLKISRVFRLGYPTMTLSSASLPSMIPKIAEIFQAFKPERVYCLNRSDAHSDHRVLFNAVTACTKSFRHPYIRDVYMYECISETEFAPALPENSFSPNCFVDISEQFEEKLDLLRIYKSELGDHPFPRSERNVRALATFRGATVGVEYAEAFQIIKSIRIEKL